MLQEKNSFALAFQGLLAAQKQALAAKSIAGGEHLLFMGSGRDNEDQYVRMVVSYCLKKNCSFVSVLVGGYEGETPFFLLLSFLFRLMIKFQSSNYFLL
jgi:hypothetical protein